MTNPTPPSIGRIVHHTEEIAGDPELPPQKVCRAAVVTEVSGDGGAPTVSLTVFGMFASGQITGVEHEEIDDQVEPGPAGRTTGTWHWPEVVS